MAWLFLGAGVAGITSAVHGFASTDENTRVFDRLGAVLAVPSVPLFFYLAWRRFGASRGA